MVQRPNTKRLLQLPCIRNKAAELGIALPGPPVRPMATAATQAAVAPAVGAAVHGKVRSQKCRKQRSFTFYSVVAAGRIAASKGGGMMTTNGFSLPKWHGPSLPTATVPHCKPCTYT